MARKRHQFNAPLNLSPSVQNITELCFAPDNSPSKVFIPVELITEILSLLSVKTIVRFKCVSKLWNTLISDSNFVDKHLKLSSQNPHLTLYWYQQEHECFDVVPFSVYRLLKSPCINLYYSEAFHRLKYRLENLYQLVGSCNGLLCLHYNSEKCTQTVKLCFWNPATKTTSKKLGSLRIASRFGYFNFTFGYDASTRTYKVVAYRPKVIGGLWKSEVKVFTLGDNRWRNIQSFPVVPFNWLDDLDIPNRRLNEGVYFSGTINWLAHVEQFVIVSLCLSTESYKQFLLPPGFYEVPFLKPVLRVLMDCLCFSYDSNKTEFVLWQMKQYGVHESWTQLFKISYRNLQMHSINGSFQLACLYVNGDVVIFANPLFKNQHFIYNLKDKTVERIKFKNCIQWLSDAMHYVESLVSVC